MFNPNSIFASRAGSTMKIPINYVSSYEEQGISTAPQGVVAQSYFDQLTKEFTKNLEAIKESKLKVISIDVCHSSDVFGGGIGLSQESTSFPKGEVLHWINCFVVRDALIWKVEGAFLIEENQDFRGDFFCDGKYKAFAYFLKDYCERVEDGNYYGRSVYYLPANTLNMNCDYSQYGAKYNDDNKCVEYMNRRGVGTGTPYTIEASAPNSTGLRAFLRMQFQLAEEQAKKNRW